ncbi:MAG: hypothetical protein ISR82_01305 [Candidatus Marinimicrobia bacterium]|nr:hypothetical protein [Candidatus Neomarinimicrobiota bacterium]MBL7009843.1 hypothetical protein [Candidatus Neomarinimicrobiota bacterium]MBL7029918.1 hypothetical protein [Candidatus Neomarinimicrobiota bacterium]
MILLTFFTLGLGLSYFTILSLRAWHEKIQGGQKYSHEVRVTPFGLFGIATIYTTILYMSMGDLVTRWILNLIR